MTTTKKKAKPVPSTVMVGGKLRKRPIPNPTAALAARFRRDMEFHEEQRKQAAQNAAAERQQKDAEHAQKCRDVAMLRAGAANLSPLNTQKLANIVEAQRSAPCVAGGVAFDVYRSVQDALVRLGYGVAVRANENPLDAQRPPPPPRSPRQAPPTTPAEQARANQAENARFAAVERAKRDQDQRIKEEEAYRAALRRLGLNPPEQGSEYSGRGITHRE